MQRMVEAALVPASCAPRVVREHASRCVSQSGVGTVMPAMPAPPRLTVNLFGRLR